MTLNDIQWFFLCIIACAISFAWGKWFKNNKEDNKE